MTAAEVKDELAKHASDHDALFLQRFFKTKKGEYGEGDKFIGVRVPVTRKVCRQFRDLPLDEVRVLCHSAMHEHRLAGLIILNLQYPKARDKQAIYDLYIELLEDGYINNWDLVDVTCERIVGEHLRHSDGSAIMKLALSDDLWKRRVGIISSFAYIKTGEPWLTLEIIEVTKSDTRDLIQKANGWMLREVGKRVDAAILYDFLDKNASKMPRTMLRYAIEKLPSNERQNYMEMAKREQTS